MTTNHKLRQIAMAFGLACAACAAHAQADYSAYGVLDFSYGRFEPKYGFEGGWHP